MANRRLRVQKSCGNAWPCGVGLKLEEQREEGTPPALAATLFFKARAVDSRCLCRVHPCARSPTMAKVVIDRLVKVYPEKSGPGVRAVNEINLIVEDREFMVL